MYRKEFYVELENLRDWEINIYIVPEIYTAEKWFMEEYGHEDYKIINCYDYY